MPFSIFLAHEKRANEIVYAMQTTTQESLFGIGQEELRKMKTTYPNSGEHEHTNI